MLSERAFRRAFAAAAGAAATLALVPAALSVLLLVVRTHLEDATLTEKLIGYDAYRRQTRFRLLPGVW